MTLNIRITYFGLLVLVGGIIVAAGMGIRHAFGVFLQPVVAELALSRADFGLAIAIQNLVWGLAQPLVGTLADRYGSARTLVVAGLFYIAGLALTAFSASAAALYLSLGALVGLGLSGVTFTVVLSAVGRLVSPQKRSMAFGLVSAGGSLGMLSVTPASQLFIDAYGWRGAMLILAICAMLTPLLAPLLQSSSRTAPGPSEAPSPGLRQTLGCARRHSGYWLLNAGFLVCGFHVAFIATHLPAFLNDQAVSPLLAATALGLIGFFNVLSAWLAGLYGGRYRKKYLLSGFYLGRALVITLFLLAPLSNLSVMLFAAALGLLWLGTIPLTSGLVADIFGTRYSGTLFGIVFLSHQLGSFLGAWFGGYCFERTGSYSLVWQLAILLGIVAALLHWPIRDAPVRTSAASP